MPHQTEATFKNFTAAEASAYKANRGLYPEHLYDIVYRHHKATSPPDSLGKLVDLGCGPGNSTLPWADRFEHVIGVDPSVGMIEAANANVKAGSESGGTGPKNASFIVGRAEDLGGVKDVDIITAATAAHWFDLPRFWASASAALKPGGTVALWTYATLNCHPSTPNAARVQDVLWRIENDDLGPYEVRGNRICRDLYDELTLPWQCEPPVLSFPEDQYVRKEWDREPLTDPSQHYFISVPRISIDDLEKGFATSSMVVRWREANPQLAHTEDDVVTKGMRDLREAAGVDAMELGKACVLLLFKKAVE